MNKDANLTDSLNTNTANAVTPPTHLKYFGYFANESGDGTGITYQLETNPHTTMLHLGSEVLWNMQQLWNELAQAKEDGIKVILTVDRFLFEMKNSWYSLKNTAQSEWNALAEELYLRGFVDVEFPEYGTVVAFYPCDEPDIHGLRDTGTTTNKTPSNILQQAINIMRNNPVTQRIPIATIMTKDYMRVEKGAALFDWLGYDNYKTDSVGYVAAFNRFRNDLKLTPNQRTMMVPLCCNISWASPPQSAETMYNHAINDPSVIAILPFMWRNASTDTSNTLREPPLAYLRPEYEAVGSRIKNGPAGYNSAFIAQSIPTTMQAGQLNRITVQYKNNGNLSWQQGTVRLGTQNPRDNQTWGIARVELPTNIAPREIVTFTFDVMAPSIPGNYDIRFQMVADGITWFGPMTTNLIINVTP